MEDNSISNSPITIGEYLKLLLPRLGNVRQRHVPYRPADVFAVAMSLIQKSGIYTLILNEWPPTVEGDETTDEWAKKMERMGRRWREYAGADEPRAPSLVTNHWRLLMQGFSRGFDHFREDRSLAHALLNLPRWPMRLQLESDCLDRQVGRRSMENSIAAPGSSYYRPRTARPSIHPLNLQLHHQTT